MSLVNGSEATDMVPCFPQDGKAKSATTEPSSFIAAPVANKIEVSNCLEIGLGFFFRVHDFTVSKLAPIISANWLWVNPVAARMAATAFCVRLCAFVISVLYTTKIHQAIDNPTRKINLHQMAILKINSDAAAENPKSATSGAPKLLFDVREAAARLSISVVSIRKLIRQNRLRRIPDFRKILISESELQRFATCE